MVEQEVLLEILVFVEYVLEWMQDNDWFCDWERQDDKILLFFWLLFFLLITYVL